MRKRVLVSLLTFCMILMLPSTFVLAVESTPETTVEEETIDGITSAPGTDQQENANDNIPSGDEDDNDEDPDKTEDEADRPDNEEINNDNSQDDDSEVIMDEEDPDQVADDQEVENKENISGETEELEETLDELEELLPEDAISEDEEVVDDDGISLLALENSGTCGDNLVWELADGKLTISGLGEMTSYSTSSAVPWYDQRETIENVVIQKGVTSIGRSAFAGCSNLSNIDIPEGIERIGGNAFELCIKLTDVHLPEGIKTIAISAFMDCESLVYINLPQSLTWINYDAFMDCTSLESITIPGGLTESWNRAFGGCKSLKNVVIEEGVTEISSSAFSLCTSLENVKIPSSVTYIGISAFYNCSKLVSVEIPEGVTRIVRDTFNGCESLTSIKIPRSVTEIGERAFEGCNSLSDIYYGGSEDEWDNVSGNKKYFANATIHYNCSEPEKSEYKIYCGPGYPDGYEIFDISLEDCMGKTSSTEYNPQLAHMLMAMSCSAYRENDVINSMKELEFNIDDIYTCYGADEATDLISYAFGKKTMFNGKTLVLVAIKGSSAWDMAHTDWQSNFNLGSSLLGCFWHAGFEEAANEVYGALKNFVNNNLDNTTFVVTGHSRGAAVANLLEVKLFDAKVPNENVYGYNFACPDVAAGIPTGWNWLGEHNNIFNIGNTADPVSVLPGMAGTALAAIPGNSWGKFGQSRWFSQNWNNYSENVLDRSFFAHGQEIYLGYLRKELSLSSYKTWEERNIAIGTSAIGRLFNIRCPVDVTITDDSGNTVAAVVGGEPDYCGSTFGEVMFFTDGDKKAILINRNEPLTVHLTATDDGVMEYTVQDIYTDTQEIVAQKVFDNVALTTDKQFVSEVDAVDSADIDPSMTEVKLYVLGDDHIPEKEVLADGKGTEIPIKDEESGENKPGDNPDDDKPGEGEPGENDPDDNNSDENKPGENEPGGNPEEKPSDNPGNDKLENNTGNNSSGSSGSKPDNNNKLDNKPGNNTSTSSAVNTPGSTRTQNSRKSSYKDKEDSNAQSMAENWQPTTPDEKKRYACMGKDAVRYTLPKDNAYRIVIKNAMQGPLCFKSFEAVLGDYTIGRTYNVYTLPDTVYSMEKEIRFTIKIPSDIYKAGREYKMICVTKNGLPIVYDDMDSNSETITVKTNKFYAYALIYK